MMVACEVLPERQDASEAGTGYAVSAVVTRTRAVLDGNAILWETTDRISLSNSNNTAATLTLSSGGNSRSGRFEGVFQNEPAPSDTYYAFNLFTNNAVRYDADNDRYYSKFPMSQKSGEFLPVMVAKAENQRADSVRIDFRNVGALLRIPVKGDGSLSLSSIRVSSNRVMAGEFYVDDYDDPVPSFIGTVKNINYTLSTPEVIGAEASLFNIQVPNFTYSSGLTLTFTATDGTVLEKKIGTEGLTIERNRLYALTEITFVKGEEEAEYEWSPGYLTVDGNGYRFTDTDSATGTETHGCYFQYNSSMAIEADLLDGSYDKDTLKVWYLDEDSGKYASKLLKTIKTPADSITAWSQIPAGDGGDPCARVPVAAGEKLWQTPTESQWKSWALSTQKTCKSYNKTANGVTYATYAISPTHTAYIYEGRYLTTVGGDGQGSLWCMMWVKPSDGLDWKEGSTIGYVQFKPSVGSNSNNPSYKTGPVAAATSRVGGVEQTTLHTQAHQLRCIRQTN